jgi:hypothetical protein
LSGENKAEKFEIALSAGYGDVRRGAIPEQKVSEGIRTPDPRDHNAVL